MRLAEEMINLTASPAEFDLERVGKKNFEKLKKVASLLKDLCGSYLEVI